MDDLVPPPPKKINLGNKNFILIMYVCLCLLGEGSCVWECSARRGQKGEPDLNLKLQGLCLKNRGPEPLLATLSTELAPLTRKVNLRKT